MSGSNNDVFSCVVGVMEMLVGEGGGSGWSLILLKFINYHVRWTVGRRGVVLPNQILSDKTNYPPTEGAIRLIAGGSLKFLINFMQAGPDR
jgi:hypothetical protein